MFNLKFRLQNILDGEGGDGTPPADTDQSILDGDAGLNTNVPDLNVEQFLSSFDQEEKESASKFASKFADEKGNLNVANMIQASNQI